ncbi:hypothetical protein CANARDRAFT_25975 [[Candida] arabinofermentans NRRL YB-2248]|uniref:Uncharacterized protein n=1 Tax=[Candida] arabinofermentans NRRL YB-2248 TaxID=983967 RepID=A0A1E4T7X8_9ASCO|nr:hypothetical protein CANARDRAFT_25975 [[Candida] arabinofermentans NRRL YB-2248]
MTRDSHVSYLHMKQPNHILFQEKWTLDSLPFDDIEVNPDSYRNDQQNILQQFLLPPEDTDNELNIAYGGNPLFNSSYANRMKQKVRKLNWRDLGLHEMLSTMNHVEDQTILFKHSAGVIDSTIPDGSNGGFHSSFDLTNQISTANLDDDDDDAETNANNHPHILTDVDITGSDFGPADPIYGRYGNEQPSGQQIQQQQQQQPQQQQQQQHHPFSTPILPNRNAFHNMNGSTFTGSRPQQPRRSSANSNAANNSDYQTPQTTHTRIIR